MEECNNAQQISTLNKIIENLSIELDKANNIIRLQKEKYQNMKKQINNGKKH